MKGASLQAISMEQIEFGCDHAVTARGDIEGPGRQVAEESVVETGRSDGSKLLSVVPVAFATHGAINEHSWRYF
jgi:hypothetical protein